MNRVYTNAYGACNMLDYNRNAVTSGMPQGSVLGPVLFILYINDLPQKVKSHCVLFADDAKLFIELKQLKDFEEIQDDLYELCVWASKWLLFF